MRKLKLSEKNCHSHTPPLLPTHRHLLHRLCFPPLFYGWTLSLQKTSLSTCTMNSTQGSGANNPPLSLPSYQKFPSLLDYFHWHVISPILKKINIIKFKNLSSLLFSLQLTTLLVRAVSTPLPNPSFLLLNTPSNPRMTLSLHQKCSYQSHQDIHVAESNHQCSVLVPHKLNVAAPFFLLRTLHSVGFQGITSCSFPPTSSPFLLLFLHQLLLVSNNFSC